MFNGELRGQVQIPENSLGIDIDPSGLYAVIVSPSRNVKGFHLFNIHHFIPSFLD